ncbi:MAG: response regulator [Bdellovibrionota bacterium]
MSLASSKSEDISVRSVFPKNRILIIDDDVDMGSVIKHKIEALQPNVHCKIIQDPYEALLELVDHKYDFILLDQRIPGLQGSSILSQVDKFIDEDELISESGRFDSPLPVVIMSGEHLNLGHSLKLKNFKLLKTLNKKNLQTFITESFAH